MQPMNIRVLVTQIMTELEADARNGAPMTVVDAFRQLSSDLSSLSEAHLRLFFECCLMLARFDFSGLSGEAQSALMQLYREHPDFEFRPTARLSELPAQGPEITPKKGD